MLPSNKTYHFFCRYNLYEIDLLNVWACVLIGFWSGHTLPAQQLLLNWPPHFALSTCGAFWGLLFSGLSDVMLLPHWYQLQILRMLVVYLLPLINMLGGSWRYFATLFCCKCPWNLILLSSRVSFHEGIQRNVKITSLLSSSFPNPLKNPCVPFYVFSLDHSSQNLFKKIYF